MISIRKIRYILKEERKGIRSYRQIWKTMKVSKSTFYRIIKKFREIPLYKIKEHLIKQGLPGRKPDETPLKHLEKVIQYRLETRANDKMISRLLKENEGIQIPHCKIYKILKSASLIHMLKNKRKKKTWVRWERKHALSLWQTDWTTFNGKWLMVILDDASRLVVGWGLFDKATSKNSVKVVKEAIEEHGRPKAFLTGRDVQFYCSDKKGRKRGETYFQKFLEANNIKHILARVNHPQTCGKIERFFGEVKIRINKWKDFETVDEVVYWHNTIKPHMSLSDDEKLVTPKEAFVSKMHHKKNVIKTFTEVKGYERL